MTVPYQSIWPDVSAAVPVNLETARLLIEDMKAAEAAALVEADKWKTKWQNVCHERDDALDVNLRLTETLRLATKDAKAYCADREELAAIVDDMDADLKRLAARMEELGQEA